MHFIIKPDFFVVKGENFAAVNLFLFNSFIIFHCALLSILSCWSMQIFLVPLSVEDV